MALLEISPQSIDVSYYEYPSWDDQFRPPRVDDPILMFKETILPR